MSRQVDDEMLMALADGELDSAQAEAILRLAESDPTVAARLARFRRSRQVVADAFAPLQNAPVPEALTSAVMQGRRAWSIRPVWALPIAAALAGVGVALGILLSPPDVDRSTLLATVAAIDWGLDLAQTPTGGDIEVTTGGRILEARVTGTYPTQRGDCRSFVVSADAGQVNGMACLDGLGWQTVLLLPVSGDSYVTASDTASAAIDILLDSFEAEPPLEPTDEARRISDGWR